MDSSGLLQNLEDQIPIPTLLDLANESKIANEKNSVWLTNFITNNTNSFKADLTSSPLPQPTHDLISQFLASNPTILANIYEEVGIKLLEFEDLNEKLKNVVKQTEETQSQLKTVKRIVNGWRHVIRLKIVFRRFYKPSMTQEELNRKLSIVKNFWNSVMAIVRQHDEIVRDQKKLILLWLKRHGHVLFPVQDGLQQSDAMAAVENIRRIVQTTVALPIYQVLNQTAPLQEKNMDSWSKFQKKLRQLSK